MRVRGESGEGIRWLGTEGSGGRVLGEISRRSDLRIVLEVQGVEARRRMHVVGIEIHGGGKKDANDSVPFSRNRERTN